MTDPLPLTGAVLAGGASRRMGRPKATLPGPDGRPLLEGALAALRRAGAASCLVSGDSAALPDPGVPVVPDRTPERGPLAGLEAVLEASPTDWLLLVACDMPGLDPAVLAPLARRALSGERAAVVPRVEGRLQPLHAAYHRRCLPAVRAALAADRLSLTALVHELDAEVVDHAPDPSFANVNTPEELKAWREGKRR